MSNEIIPTRDKTLLRAIPGEAFQVVDKSILPPFHCVSSGCAAMARSALPRLPGTAALERAFEPLTPIIWTGSAIRGFMASPGTVGHHLTPYVSSHRLITGSGDIFVRTHHVFSKRFLLRHFSLGSGSMNLHHNDRSAIPCRASPVFQSTRSATPSPLSPGDARKGEGAQRGTGGAQQAKVL